jgi:transposase, IS5 family
MVGARTFPGNPYDGHLLHAQVEQTKILLEPHAVAPKQVLVWSTWAFAASTRITPTWT